MKVWGKITGVAERAESHAYRCWMCGAGHDSPSEYLWHINAHKPEITGQPIMLMPKGAMDIAPTAAE